jgi:hypothetical protein
MDIIRTTTESAAEVLTFLLSAGQRPIHDFAIEPILSTAPPITFTLLITLTAAQVTKIRAVPDTTIGG